MRVSRMPSFVWIVSKTQITSVRLLVSLMMLCTGVTTSSNICTQDICTYEFAIERKQTMTYPYKDGKETYNVVLDGMNLHLGETASLRKDIVGQVVQADDVITADGYPRDVITINGRFPGPTIEVMEGAEVKVTVTNLLESEGLTIHWHGLQQNPWMDGVAYVTQYPIMPQDTFEYKFKAGPSGTHWYYSHFASQRMDGLFGLFLVHKTQPTLPYFAVSIMDWYHKSSEDIKSTVSAEEVAEVSSQDNVLLSAHTWQSGLINGRGRKDCHKFPLTHFHVEKGKTYVFKLCHTGSEQALEISLDLHSLNITAMDGHTIRPIVVDHLIVYPGECFDFDIQALGWLDKYWMRAKTLEDVRGREYMSHRALAVLQYTNHLPSEKDPQTGERPCTFDHHCVTFNCPFAGYADLMYRDCISVDTARSAESTQAMSGVHSGNVHSSGEQDKTQDDKPPVFFYNFAGSSVNSHQWVPPSSPLYDLENHSALKRCSESCGSECSCTYVDDLPLEHTVHFVLTSYSPQRLYHQPVHLHGHSFAILKVGYPEYDHNTGNWTKPNADIQCLDKLCKATAWADGKAPELNLESPPVKDTVVVPAHGYVVIQVRTSSPGYWLLHSVREGYTDNGMAMLLNVSGNLVPSIMLKSSTVPKSSTSKDGDKVSIVTSLTDVYWASWVILLTLITPLAFIITIFTIIMYRRSRLQRSHTGYRRLRS